MHGDRARLEATVMSYQGDRCLQPPIWIECFGSSGRSLRQRSLVHQSLNLASMKRELFHELILKAFSPEPLYHIPVLY